MATSSLGGLPTTVRAAALVAAPAVAAAGPLSSSYLCLYATFTVLTCMDKFINLCALLVAVDGQYQTLFAFARYLTIYTACNADCAI